MVLHFESLKLLNIVLYADPDPAFTLNMDPGLDLAPANPNPDPQPWTKSKFFLENKYVAVTSFDFLEEGQRAHVK